MEKPTLEHVHAAIDVLYHQQGSQGKEEASKWLETFQQSMHAWELADTLLRSNRDPETVYFASQTMKTKIQFHFAELPIQTHLTLRDSLIDHMTNHSVSSNQVVSQLCLAVADLAVQCPQWKSPVDELIQKFTTKLEHFSVLLEILLIMPEEVERDSLRIGANRKEEVYQEMKGSSLNVFNLMMNCHEVMPKDEKTLCKLYQCFGSWLTLGCFPSKDVAESKLLKLAFENIILDSTSMTLHEAITDCICNAVYTASNMQTQLPLAEACFSFVISVLPKAFEAAAKEDNMDRSVNYARIFTEMAESFMEAIITNPGEGAGSLKTLDLVLSSVQHPSYEVAEITYNFWYRFAECIENTGNTELLGVFRPYIQRLIFELMKHCQHEDDHEGVVNMKDDFQEYRLRTLDVIHDCVFIVGSGKCLEDMYTHITQNSGGKWNVIEAGLFVMNPMARYINREDEGTGKVFQMACSLDNNYHLQLRHTAAVLCGDLSHWVAYHGEYLDQTFQFLLNGFQTKELQQISAVSIFKLCNQCAPAMGKMFPVLLEVSKAIDNLEIENDGVIDLLSGCAMVLAHLPETDVAAGLMHLVTPHVEPLFQIANSSVTTDPVKYLDRLACIFRNAAVKSADQTQEHPCKKVIDQLWPLFNQICQKYKSDEKVMERHFRCIRFSIRTVGKDFFHLIPSLVEMMVTIYNEYRHSCFLYLGSILADEYGMNKSVENPLMAMLKAFTEPTFKKLSVEKGLQNHPDTVDDFFRLCIRFLQKVTLRFLTNESIDNIFQLATACTTLDHREANMSVMKFIVEITKCCRMEQDDPHFNEHQERVQLVNNLLGKYGQEIIKGLINACAGGIQQYMLPEVADAFWEIMSFSQQSTLLWLKDALSNLPTHRPTGAVNATPEQMQRFYKMLSEATSIRVLWKEFRDFSKFYK